MRVSLMRSITQFHLFIYTIIKEKAYKQTKGGGCCLLYKWGCAGLFPCAVAPGLVEEIFTDSH